MAKERSDDLTFDYQFEGSLVDRYKELCVRIAQTVPELDYVEEDDFDIIIAKMAGPSTGGRKTVASMNYVTHWIRQYVEYALQRPLPPYLMIIYPAVFRYSYKDKLKVLIHELFHIKESKRGCRPHTGFGDEVIARMYSKSLKKLEKVGKTGKRQR